MGYRGRYLVDELRVVGQVRLELGNIIHEVNDLRLLQINKQVFLRQSKSIANDLPVQIQLQLFLIFEKGQQTHCPQFDIKGEHFPLFEGGFFNVVGNEIVECGLEGVAEG